MKHLTHNKKGSVLIITLVLGTVSTVIMMAMASYALFEHRATSHKHYRDSALHIAEAGISYYRWHLAHDPDDFWDGNATSTPGPYVHDYTDKDGNIIGTFSLEIDAPSAGENIVTIRSTGRTLAKPNSERTLQVRMGKASLADFTFLQNSNMSFSPTTIVSGKVHSNGGIEFNGTTDAEVQSARETYTVSGVERDGVWGDGGPAEFFQFPIPTVDFDSISGDLALLKSLAEEPEGYHRNSSGSQGYHVIFLANGTFDLYRVTSKLGYCQWWGWCVGQWYDIGNTTFIENASIPSNGAMFFDDDVWVEGVVNGRVTVAAGRFPENSSNYRKIYISDNITYNEVGSDDVLGLIAQGDIIVPLNVPEDMTIQAAALSQHGGIGRPLYRSSYANSLQDNLTFFGSQLGFESNGWKWGTPPVSGFTNTNHIYDGNLRYSPPPGFPTKDTYDLISWEEL